MYDQQFQNSFQVFVSEDSYFVVAEDNIPIMLVQTVWNDKVRTVLYMSLETYDYTICV